MGRQERRAYCCSLGDLALRLSTFTRYWHTLRHLRPVQFYGRFWFRYWRPRPDLRPTPDLCESTGPWQPPAKRLSSLSGPRDFVFLNEPGQLDKIGWDGPQRKKLWRYNQHYFDDLNAINAPARRAWHTALVEDWIVENPPAHGTGWEPYPLSLRVVNWIKWSLVGAVLSPAALHSLAVQVRWLTGRLEIHLLGNHLFANAKALVFAGLFFQGKEADAWLEKGLRILERQVPEQILPDGGHFERSTMYHALALEDMLDLCNATACFSSRLRASQQKLIVEWPQRAAAMHTWLHAMCHPDGEISLFNDAAFDISPSIAELDAYAHRLLPALHTVTKQALAAMPDSGYIRLTRDHAVALLDVAPLGPDYLPGHAHADTLSFELSVAEYRVLVNSGTSCYDAGSERLRQRGTAAHNTVIVDGQDSSEVWSNFRVGRRAYPMELNIKQEPDYLPIEISCAHNGYCRLPGSPVHRRTWRIGDSSLSIEDRIEGPHNTAEARFHFHPALQIYIHQNHKEGTALLPNGKVITWHVNHGEAHLESSTWRPCFGSMISNICLVVKLTEGSSTLYFSWAALNTE